MTNAAQGRDLVLVREGQSGQCGDMTSSVYGQTTIGQKYYRRYLAAATYDVSQPVVSQENVNGCCSTGSSTRPSFGNWMYVLEDRKQFVEDICKAVKVITGEVVPSLALMKLDTLCCEKKDSSIDGIKEVIAKLLQGQLETKQNLDQLMKCVVYQKEATNMIADKLSSFQCFKTTTNSVDMMSKCISTSEVSPLTHTAASVPDEIQMANKCKRIRLTSASSCEQLQQEKEHALVGKKVPLDTSDVNSSAEKRRLYSALDVRHLYNTMQPTDCALNNTLKSPMNALDDTLYSQVPPVPGSILPQSKSMTYEAGMHVTLDKFNRSSEAARRKEKIFADFSGSNNVFQEISMKLKDQTVESIEESP